MAYVYLPISKEMKTKIDSSTMTRLKKDGLLKWSAQKVGKRYYVSRNVGKKKVYLHRYIMQAQPGLVIDHVDRDSLNNTLENLRLCYHRDNCRNRGGTRATGFKGVGKWKHSASWTTQIQINRKHYNLGRFEREEDAAKVYDLLTVILFGEFACPNFENSWKFLKLRSDFIKEIKSL